jgi:Peptidase A4 family
MGSDVPIFPAAPPPDGGERTRAIALAVAFVLIASLGALGVRALNSGAAPAPSPTPAVSGVAAATVRPSSTPGASPAPSTTPAGPTVHRVGETVDVGEREMHVVERAERWDRPADRERIYVAVRVRVKAIAADVPFDSAYYQLTDASGGLARPIPNGREPVLAYGRLEDEGEQTTGWVTFETTDEAPYRLTYLLPLGSNAQLASIVVAVDKLAPTTPEPDTTPGPAPSTDPNPFPPGVANWGYPTARTSTFYSGYGATKPGTTVSSVTGSWIQPRGTCSGNSTSAFAAWVGIDDNGIGNLEQLGTEVQCVRGSKRPLYGAWYEMFPEVSRPISMRALPGDHFTATVTNKGNRWILAITNRTTGQKFSITKTRRAAAVQALWVAEAPSSAVTEPGDHVLPLTNFGSVTMTGCSAVVGGFKRTIGDVGWAHYRFDMETKGGVAKTTTSGLSKSSAFTVRWRHA